ncbi:MAG TPA: protein translocase subunit SecF [Candidatus Moranbacteria bacterium]|nr:MAG: protein-export membrane protein SecF, preprotein translocase subunit SecF [Parcubacteria group bacterium GW2011_GWC1_45_14]HAV11536.1 protein translocase subunit SecF [Candidatus Moranbacteria bacterium]
MFDIIGKRKYAYSFSAAAVVLSIVFLSVWGLKLGIDFKGGTLMEVRFSEGKEIQRQQIQDTLSGAGLSGLQVQATENNSYILRYGESNEQLNDSALEKLKGLDEQVEPIRVDFIGASISSQIKESAFWALLLAVVGIASYIAWAFRGVAHAIPSWQYGLGAIIALAHDIIITLGIFSILGRFFEVEVGIPFVAALLTILGYSVNDTIVVYDRTRENLVRSARKEDFEITVNKSINETLARSINSSLTVIVVLVAIIFFGGESLKYFATALLIGISFGTYSSVYVASALLVTSYRRMMEKV